MLIAGRSPSTSSGSIQHGARASAWSALMRPVVAPLDLDDMIAIAAYVASRPVKATDAKP